MDVREPQQQRAILKKNKILEASYQLFSEVGYYSTNTAEIAKRANVSTGIVYGYFKDKRDILLNILEIYINDAYTPILTLFDEMEVTDFEKLIPHIVEEAILTHKKNKNIHEALHSMTHTDDKINEKFIELEDLITSDIYEKLKKTELVKKDGLEKIHLAMDMVQSFSHEYIYDKHLYIDYEKMKSLVCTSIIKLFKD